MLYKKGDVMKRWLVAVCAVLFSMCAAAEDGARVVFASGEVSVGAEPAVVGMIVAEGDVVRTGANGHVYLKTIDEGFFILRPGSVGRLEVYHVDVQEPLNTRIRLSVDAGVVRHISGAAVTQARQNFRLNTPVAAIGVKGTDFSVFTTEDVSRVIVHSGAVVVSPLSDSCAASAYGPCADESSRELLGVQAGLILQVSRGQQAPQFLQDSSLSPDALKPPRPEEPGGLELHGESRAHDLTRVDLSPAKIDSVDRAEGPATDSSLHWGRWEVVLGQDKEMSIVDLLETHQLIATGGGFAVLREREGTWRRPAQNSMSFALQDGSAVIQNEQSGVGTLASLQDGLFSVNFSDSTFSTSLRLVAGEESFALRASGVVTPEGRLYSAAPVLLPSNMSVRGALGTDNRDAAYVFQSRLDGARVAAGVTYWAR